MRKMLLKTLFDVLLIYGLKSISADSKSTSIRTAIPARSLNNIQYNVENRRIQKVDSEQHPFQRKLQMEFVGLM